jgi:pimeloyl-ACP methyl ester carboxylesterase
MGDFSGYAIAPLDGSPIFYRVSAPPAAGAGGDVQPGGMPGDARSTAGGSSATVVLTDGVGCDGFVWRYLRTALGGRFRIIHWHHRGHGRSPRPRAGSRPTIADLAGDLAAVLDDTDTDTAVLAGHSMGVQVSLELYRQQPGRVRGLILMCGAPANPLRTFRGSDFLESVLPWARAVVSRVPGVFNTAARYILPTRLAMAVAARVEVNASLVEPRDFMPYLEGLSRIDVDLFLSLVAAAGAHSAEDVLARIQVPTLIVAGDRDGFTPPELSHRMSAAIPGAELLMIEQGSHTAPLERPEVVNAAVLRFLEERVLAAPRNTPAGGDARP